MLTGAKECKFLHHFVIITLRGSTGSYRRRDWPLKMYREFVYLMGGRITVKNPWKGICQSTKARSPCFLHQSAECLFAAVAVLQAGAACQ